MNDAAKHVRVELRHVQLAAAAPAWATGEGGYFVALDPPPPVRTLLALHTDDAPRVAVEVTKVVELASSTPHGRVGCEARVVPEAALERFLRVGTEHHEAGRVPIESTPAEAGSDVVALPAPVLESDVADEDEGSEETGDERSAEDHA